MRNYQDYVERKTREFGDKFDTSDLNKNFISYFESEIRIEVDFGYETKRGRIGITTGWKPSFLLMLTTRSMGSSYLINKDCKVLKVISL